MAASNPDTKPARMPYRFLGNSGLLVSKLSLGSWMDFDEKYTAENWYEMMALAFKHGVNFFDNAEAYGADDLVITTKIFFGSKGFEEGAGPNAQGLSRKHIVEGTKASLARLQLDYVDVIFCHRPESFTPIEETVRAMNFVIEQGWAFYWGTSQWTAAEIIEACDIADRLGLIRPVVEQPVYNVLNRSKVEFEYADLYKKYKLGLTTWSPLAYGALTGKYSAGTPEGSRFEKPMWKSMTPEFADRVAEADKLKPIAEELGCPMALLAIAWCLTNENVSTVMMGAKTLTQLEQNLKALEVADRITPEVKAKIDALLPFVPTLPQPDAMAMARARFL
ncbi:hypothetical protein BBJ28_00004101 [Nothophytophthora sp. Chile5]|nr:hypothetical protein BBJ28_00004101 [Nothophytophthora sp. Chile5]